MMDCSAALKPMICTTPVHSFFLFASVHRIAEKQPHQRVDCFSAIGNGGYSYAQIGAYRSLSRTSFISRTGSNFPLATMEKILGVQPLIRITPCSFIWTGCC